MTTELAVAEKLTEVCRSFFGDETKWISAAGYPHSLALCIIDSIFSTGSQMSDMLDADQVSEAMFDSNSGGPPLLAQR
ncbi:hypothetical protein [Arthrobacter sp. NPDC057259]|uniref:hypothetical protein n=1 Tax=Arthrobacter sp. NPDC057259 TaxID=3346073 RepID=UPI00363B5558